MRSPPRRKSCFEPTLENYRDINQTSDYIHFFLNSVIEAVGATIVCILLAAPAAYAMAFFPTRKTKDILMWMLSTKMMPAVGVLVPIYLLAISTGLLDTRTGIVIIYTLMNLPIVVWMLYSLLSRGAQGDPRGGPHGRRDTDAAAPQPAAAALPARHHVDLAAVDHHLLERGILEFEPHGLQGGAAHRVHRPFLKP